MASHVTSPFYEEIDAIIGTQATSSPVKLLESSHAASPETLDLSSHEHCEMMMLETWSLPLASLSPLTYQLTESL